MRPWLPSALAVAVTAAAARGGESLDSSTLILGPEAPGARFGAGIAREGRLLVCGAPRDAAGAAGPGEVLVYSLSDAGWGLRQTLHGGGQEGDAFGRAVALEGETLVVGAPHAPSASGPPGEVWWFRREAGGFVLGGAIVPAAGDPGAMFGAALDLDGGRLVVGAPMHSSGGVLRAGQARVFVRVGADWVEEQRIEAPSPEPHARFGFAVALSGDRLVVGAPLEVEAERVGTARVYERTGGAWVLEQTIVAGPVGAHDRFGWALDLAGDVLVAGAPDASGGGLARVFERVPGAGFGEVATLVDPAGVPGDRFGFAVAVSEGLVAVGAPNAGRVLTFERGRGEWAHRASFAPQGATSEDEYGAAAFLEGSRLTVGAPRASGAAGASGAVFEHHVWRRELGRLECPGDGSAAFCPCGNPGGAGEGCANSLGRGATLAAMGSASVTAGDLEVVARGLPPGATALLFAARVPLGGGAGVPFADGILCAGGTAVRVATGAADEHGTAHWPPGEGSAVLEAGGERRFQVAYSDPYGPCGTGINLSPALAIEVEP